MEIQPLKRYTPRPFAILYPGHRTLGVLSADAETVYKGRRQIERALQDLSNHLLFVHSSLESLKHTTGALSWQLNTWRGRQTGMVHLPSGAKVTSLRQTLVTSPDPYADVEAVLSWLSNYGVSPGSISGMAWNLFRASLSRTVVISADAELGRSSFYGGRQQCSTPKVYKGMQAVDITAAYPHAMATRDYALSLREVSPQTFIDPEEPGIAVAKVYVPSDMPYGPVPIRVDTIAYGERVQAIQFPYGVLNGTWTWCELDAAAQLGCKVEVVKCFAPRRRADLFGAWWQMAQTGRSLPGNAPNLAKAVMNSTWGQFAMTGEDRAQVKWTTDSGDTAYEVQLDDRKMPHRYACHIASETTSRVRRRLLLEGLYGPTKPPVHADTDGIVVSASSEMPKDSGTGFGQWRKKETMTQLDLRAPQLYRYLCGPQCGTTHPQWHYVASGMAQPAAERYFTTHNHLRTTVAFFGGPDQVLPIGFANDPAELLQLQKEARSIA